MGTTGSKPTFVNCEAALPPPPPPLPESMSQPSLPPTSTTSTKPSDDTSAIPSSGSKNTNTDPNNNSINPNDSEQDASSLNIPNPGPYEAATIACKRLTNIDTHTGFKCDIQKQLSPYMVAIHSFHLGTSLPDGRNKAYMFITQVADEEGLFMTNVDPEKKTVNGRIHRSLLGGLAMGKIQCSVSPDGSNDQLLGEVDFGGMTWTGNFKYGSMGGGPIVGMNYYQSITRRLAMGGEGMYIAANGNMLSSYTLKYECEAPGEDALNSGSSAIASAAANAAGLNNMEEKPSSWFCAQLHPAQGMLNLNYKRVVTPRRVSLAAELQMASTLDSQVVFGAEFQLSRSKFAMTVDGSGKIQSQLESALGMAPGSPKLNFSADVDFAKDTMSFGYGLNIG
mmetsp:Transcript_12962/g.24362  ORF Transcript_12962/g.24362 Transcript_12962/m.24362 type:complete len:394 (-) Transcript_12962:174-1355(-)|eukprot:CAMPEP_0176497040 /NCGR_PEP_ID=MMETSP0200_2-20121128/11510_1 /TAXON_ID=947934 /ORGANISM="Chaetoceros sp., Strain GSL56" /LENGTH=393 /DNA_ID=CAMNT_0017895023 /DNA_START=106 /DNA_END=1287 /DNA_ORIENTATION=+